MRKYSLTFNQKPTLVLEVTDDKTEAVIFIPSKRLALGRTWARELAQQLMDFSDGKFGDNQTPPSILPKWDGPELSIG